METIKKRAKYLDQLIEYYEDKKEKAETEAQEEYYKKHIIKNQKALLSIYGLNK